MAIKKYTSGAWVPTSYRKYGTETDTITSLPAQIIGDGQPITSCQISGNTVQDGTPTPEDPADVVGCGVRTENLFPLDESKLHVGRIENDGTIDYKVGTLTVGTDNVTYEADTAWRGFYTDFIQVNENENLTFSPNNSSITTWFCSCYDENGGFLGQASGRSANSIKIFTLLTGTKKVRISVTCSNTSYTITKPMLNAGSTALPYEPYGVKLPLTVNGTEYPIYLGQVETARKIKKLVLTGEETWSIDGGKSGAYSATNESLGISAPIQSYAYQLSSHFALADRYSVIYYNTGYFAIETKRLIISYFETSSVDSFKSYLAQQYANGTPVTIWYVLATAETGIINEPLMKIGDYADTVTAANVPTTGTPENFDVGTTLKPSEVQLTYHGWHEHTDTKYTE